MSERVVFQDVVKISEKIDSTIKVWRGQEVLLIEVGNTGFRVRLIKNEAGNFDFTPEGNYGDDVHYKAKHATILGCALYEMYRWMNDPSEKESGLVGQVSEISAITNPRLVSAITGLFSRYGQANLVKEVPAGIAEHPELKRVTINIKEMARLSETDDMVKSLSKYHQRAQNYSVLVDKVVPNSEETVLL